MYTQAGRRGSGLTGTRTKLVALLTVAGVVAAGTAALAGPDGTAPTGAAAATTAAESATGAQTPHRPRTAETSRRGTTPAPVLPARTRAEAASAQAAARRAGTTLVALDEARLDAAIRTATQSSPGTATARNTGAEPLVIQAGIQPLGSDDLVTAAVPRGTWAPDGSRFAYRSGAATLRTVRPDGTGAFAKGGVTALDMAWSPAGGYLFVLGAKKGHKEQLFVESAGGFRFWTEPLPASVGRFSAVSYVGIQNLVLSSALGTTAAATRPMVTVDVRQDRFVPRPFGSAAMPVEARTGTLQAATGSPDGSHIAYVRVLGADREVWVTNRAYTSAVRVATGAVSGRPVWSADSATVFVTTAASDGLQTVTAYPRGGGDPRIVAEGIPSSRTVFRRPVSPGPVPSARYGGTDAVHTAVAASRNTWVIPAAQLKPCAQGGAQAAVLVRSNSWLEAIPATPLAATKCGPLLLTPSAALDRRTAAELRRVVPRGRTVYLVGSVTALRPAVATGLTRLGYRVIRIAGTDPYDTSVQVAVKGFRSKDAAIFASATNWVDGLTAGAAAGWVGVPVLLTAGARMPASVDRHVDRYDVGAWAVGSEAVMAAPWATRSESRAGTSTSVRVAWNFFTAAYNIPLATTSDYPHSLTAGAIAAASGSPLLFTGTRLLENSAARYIDANSGSVEYVEVFGRPTVLSQKIFDQAVTLAGGRRPAL